MQGKIEVVPFEPEHLTEFTFRAEQAREVAMVLDTFPDVVSYGRFLLSHAHDGICYSAIDTATGKAVACAGITDYTPTTGIAWALLSEHLPRYAGIPIARRVRFEMHQCLLDSVITTVGHGFHQAERWVGFLGLSKSDELTAEIGLPGSDIYEIKLRG